MSNLGSATAPIQTDLKAGYASVGTLLAKVNADTSPSALTNDAKQFETLHRALVSLEGNKVAFAKRVDDGMARLHAVERALEFTGGFDVNSALHAQTLGMGLHLAASQADFQQALSLLGQATLGGYPSDIKLLPPAHSLIEQALIELGVVSDYVAQLHFSGRQEVQYRARLDVLREILKLDQLRTRVFLDSNLNDLERANINGQINHDIVALGQLTGFLAVPPSEAALIDELSVLLSEPGVFVLIGPKADIILAAADDRAATEGLAGLVPGLQAKINAASSRHLDVTSAQALLVDLQSQLAAAAADTAPVDDAFLPMTALTASQRNHDGAVIQATIAALADANRHLAAATSDAGQILAQTA